MKKRYSIKKRIIVLGLAIATLCLTVTGCGSKENSESEKKADESVKYGKIIIENKTGKTLIQTVSKSNSYPFNTYMITSKSGESVILDPTEMPKKEEVDFKPAAIVSTHSHPDHIDNIYRKSYHDTPQLLFKPGTLETKDFKITNIASSHMGDDINETNPTNAITIVEVDGLRIVHMGDCGQTSLTDDELKQIGKVDVMITQFNNSYSNMTIESNMGNNLVDQVKPAIVIPTHYAINDLTVLAKKYGEIKEFDTTLELTKDDIPKDGPVMYRILNSQVK